MSTIETSQAAVSVTVGREEISFETGKLAKQAGGVCRRPSRRVHGARHGTRTARAA